MLGALTAGALLAAPIALGGQGNVNGVGPGKVCPRDKWFSPSPAEGDEAVDKNGDGLICVRPVRGRGSSPAVPGFTTIDNLITQFGQ